jgi:hypothetical protein
MSFATVNAMVTRRPVPAHLLALLGVLALGAPPAAALVNGSPLSGGEHRFLVKLEAERGSTRLHCTGALIAPTVVLTAGHCVFGATRVSVHPADPETGRLAPPTRGLVWTAHPLWAGAAMGEGWDARVNSATASRYVDLGLVLLAEAPRGARPVPLASRSVATGAAVRTFGLERGPLLEERARVDTASALVIGGLGEGALFRVMGERGLAWCPGDSGGPVTVETPMGPRLAGVLGLGTMGLTHAPDGPVARHWGGARNAPPCGRVATIVDAPAHAAWIETTLDLLLPGRTTTLAGLRR